MNLSSVVRSRGFCVLVLLALSLAFVRPVHGASDSLSLHTVTPCRLFDSREPADAPPLAANAERTITVAGLCGIPADAVSVSLNVTVVLPPTEGHVILYAGDAALPPLGAGAMPFQTGKTRAREAIVDLAGDASGTIKAFVYMPGAAQLNLVVDVNGYFKKSVIANDDTATVTEDDGATAIDVLANDTNPGGAFTIGSVTQPANGTVVITGSGTGLTYQPNANYCNTPPGTTDDFTYTLTPGPGFTATVRVTVNCVNDAPSFTKGPDQTVNEDAGAQTVNPWATAISPGPPAESGQTVSFEITANDNPGLFAVGGGPAVSATGVLTYTPAANASGVANITLQIKDDGGTANGGVDTSATQSFVITVNAVNDAPSFTKGPDQTVDEGAGAQTVNPWATAISPGPPDESGQTVSFEITANDNPGLFAVGGGPAVSATGVLTYTPAANASGVANITLRIKDDGGTANGGVDTSATQSFVITVTGINDAPSFIKGPDQTVDEDAGAQTVNPWATAISPGPPDESGQTVSFEITANDNPGLFAVGGAPAVSATGVLTYTPAANASGVANITLRIKDDGGTANGGVDTSATQSFVITVTGINDPPSFTKGPDQTVNEDTGAQTANPWATAISPGPPDESGQTVSFEITANDNPGLFAVGGAPAVSATGVLTYTPATNASGVANITLRIKDDGGTANGGVDASATQTFVITLTGINDAPSFTKGPDQTVNEDAGAQTVNPWATAVSPGPPDESGQTVSFEITANDNPGLFAVGGAPAVSATGVLTYTPAANASGVANITLRIKDDGGTANGGVDTSATQSFVITVNAVNDAPSFIKGPDQTVNEDAGAQTANPWATAISPGPPAESGQTVSFEITANDNPGLFAVGGAPAVSATGVLTYTPAANASGVANITLRIKDNGGTANGGVDTSATQSFVITVNAVNDAPSFTKGPDQAVNEDAGAQTVNPWATAISPGPPAESGQTVSFEITANDNPGLFAVGGAPAVSATGALTYTPAANAFGVANITLRIKDNGGTANGGVDTSATQSFVITVNAANDAPSFTKGPDQTVLEDSGSHTVDPWATGVSPGPPEESGQTVSFEIIANDNLGLFTVGGAPAVSATGALTYTLADNAFGVANITLRIKDNGGTANGGVDVSATQTFVITVTGVNDAPSFDVIPNPAPIDEDSLQQTVNITGITAGPNEGTQPLQVTAVSNNPAVIPNPTVVYTSPNATGSLKYTPVANAFGTATITVTLTDGGNDNNLGTLGDNLTFSRNFDVVVNSVNDLPVAGIDNWETFGNTELRVDLPAGTTPNVADTTTSGFGVRDNDDDPVEHSPLTILGIVGCTDPSAPFGDSPVCNTTNGGKVVMEGNGKFTYTPPVGNAANDSFKYLLSDGTDTVQGTVNLTIHEMIWYVDPAGSAGNGTSVSPFNALTAATLNGAGGAGDKDDADDYIFIYKGTLNGSIELEAGEHLLGHGVGLNLNQGLNGNPNVALVGTDAQPVLNNGSGDAVKVTAAMASEIRGLAFSATGGNGIDVTASGAYSGASKLTIATNTFQSATAEDVDINANATGTMDFDVNNNIWSTTAASHGNNGFDLRTTNGAVRLAFSNNSVVASSTGVFVDGSGGGTITITGFASNAIHQNTVGTGISINAATFDATPGIPIDPVSAVSLVVGVSGDGVGGSGVQMTNVQGSLSFPTTLNIFASNGAGLRVSGTGSGMSLASGIGAGIVEATNGPAVDITSTALTLPLSSLKSTNSTSTGVALSSVSGTFSAPSGSITGSTTAGFQVGSSSATVSYGGTITTTAGKGVDLTSNTGTISFTGKLTLSSGSSTAFNATGGGTVTATDTTSTLTSTSGMALNVSGTTIGAGGLKFQSISAGTPGTGPTNGIVLNNTGNTAGLTVSGTGTTDGSGGTIQKTSGDGIVLTSTRFPNLKNMTIGDSSAVAGQAANATNNIGGNGITMNGADDVTLDNIKIARTAAHGIDGTGVTNLTLTNSEILNAGDSNEDSAMDFSDVNQNNLDGTVQISNTVFDAFTEDGIFVENFSGTLAMTVSGCTFGNSANTLCGGSTCGENGIQIRSDGTATYTLTVNGSSQFNAVDGNGILAVAEGTSATPSVVNVSSTTFTNSTALGIVLFGGTGDATSTIQSKMNFTIGPSVSLTGTKSTAISIQPNGKSTMRGTVTATVNGSQIGRGIEVLSDDASTAVVSITNSNVSNTAFNGIFASNQNVGKLDLHVRNNIVSAPLDTVPASGLAVHGTEVNVRETSVNCLDIAANQSAGNAASGGAGYRARQRDTSTFKLERFAGSGTSVTDVQNFLVAQNTSGTASATVNTTYTGVADGACEDP